MWEENVDWQNIDKLNCNMQIYQFVTWQSTVDTHCRSKVWRSGYSSNFKIYHLIKNKQKSNGVKLTVANSTNDTKFIDRNLKFPQCQLKKNCKSKTLHVQKSPYLSVSLTQFLSRVIWCMCSGVTSSSEPTTLFTSSLTLSCISILVAKLWRLQHNVYEVYSKRIEKQ